MVVTPFNELPFVGILVGLTVQFIPFDNQPIQKKVLLMTQNIFFSLDGEDKR